MCLFIKPARWEAGHGTLLRIKHGNEQLNEARTPPGVRANHTRFQMMTMWIMRQDDGPRPAAVGSRNYAVAAASAMMMSNASSVIGRNNS
jgi:hypothetical protein